MKVLTGSFHPLHVSAPVVGSSMDCKDGFESFEAIYASRFQAVCRWARVLGAPAPDLEDLVQEVFIIAARKLSTFDGRNLDGWLFRITQRTVRDHRRSAWIRRIWRTSEASLSEAPAPSVDAETPQSILEQQRRRALLRGTLEKLSEKRRVVLELFELEGYSGEEIAELLDVPVATVWTRLHHARKQFLTLVAALPEGCE